jgi:hypothetical protein
MAIHRRFLYAGLFLVAVGGVLVAADVTGVDGGRLREALRLWPLAFIAIGLGIVVRRSRIALPAGVLAAVAPGLLLGGSLVAGPGVAMECSAAPPPSRTFLQEGVLAAPATISLSAACGTATITTIPGNAWRLSAGSTDARDPDVFAEEGILSIESPGRGGRQLLFGDRREAWDVTLPTTFMETLSLTATANTTVVALPGAHIGAVVIEANASSLRLDATGATIDQLDLEVNVGSATIVLPATRKLGGRLEVNGGTLRLCQPLDTGLIVSFAGDGPREVTVNGQRWSADVWTGGNVLSSNQAALTVDATLGSVDINPIGGC